MFYTSMDLLVFVIFAIEKVCFRRITTDDLLLRGLRAKDSMVVFYVIWSIVHWNCYLEEYCWVSEFVYDFCNKRLLKPGKLFIEVIYNLNHYLHT